MANLQITEFPQTSTFGPDDSFHVVGEGINKHIIGSDLVAGIRSNIVQDGTLTQKGVVQLSNSTTSTSQTLAATSYAVKQVWDRVQNLTPVSNVLDKTPGRATTVGWGGLGTNGLSVSNFGPTDNSLLSGGFYGINGVGAPGAPAGVGTANIIHFRRAAGGGEAQLYLVDGYSGTITTGKRPSSLMARFRRPEGWTDDRWFLSDADVVTSTTDTTVNRIPTVGWMGQGKSILLTSTDNILNLPFIANNTNLKYSWFGSSVPAGLPVSVGGYLERQVLSTGVESLLFHSGTTNSIYVNTRNTGSWTGWELLNNGSAPVVTSEIDGWVNIGNVATTGSQSVNINLSSGRAFYMSMETANTSGILSFNFSNIPASGAVDGILIIRRPGIKQINISGSGAWALGVVPTFPSTPGSHAVIQYSKMPYESTFTFTVNQVK